MAAATYSDVYTLINDGPTQNRVLIACLKTAYNVNNESTGTTNHANRLAWAKATLANPVSAASNALKFVLAAHYAANPAVDLPTLIGLLTDATLQSYVDASLGVFAS